MRALLLVASILIGQDPTASLLTVTIVPIAWLVYKLHWTIPRTCRQIWRKHNPGRYSLPTSTYRHINVATNCHKDQGHL